MIKIYHLNQMSKSINDLVYIVKSDMFWLVIENKKQYSISGFTDFIEAFSYVKKISY